VFKSSSLGLGAEEASASPMGLLCLLARSGCRPASKLARPASKLATFKRETFASTVSSQRNKTQPAK